MAAVVPDDGLIADVQALLGIEGANVTIRLFKNDYTPDSSSMPSSFVEADYDGYAAYNGGGWSDPYVDSLGRCVSTSPPLSFACTGAATPNVVFGYWAEVVIASVRHVIQAERLAFPVPMDEAGKTVPLTLYYVAQRA